MAEKALKPESAGGSFGTLLREAREAKGISLSEVGQVTRLTPATLVFLENEDWERLPPPAFVKGFVAAYAEAVEIDPEPALDLYRKALERISPPPSRGLKVGAASWLVQVAVLAVFTLVVATLVFMICLPGGDAERNAAPGTMARNRAVERPEALAAPVLRLKISAREETWVRVMADGVEKGRFSLAPGGSVNLTAKKGFNLLVGTPSAVTISLDGKNVPVPSRAGQAVNLRLP